MFKKILTTICVLLSWSLLVSAQKKVTINVNDMPVAAVLEILSEQSGYEFFYSSGTLDPQMKVSANVKSKDLLEVVDILFSGQGIAASVVDNSVILSRKKIVKKEENDEDKVFRGRIVDSEGEPVIAALVTSVENPKNLVIADMNGNFSIPSDRNGEPFEISFLGFKTLSVVSAPGMNLFKLETDPELLEEVVIVGYGTQKKVNLTGAVSVIDSETIANRPVTSLANAIQGADPSLTISNLSGSVEGSYFTTNIRGMLSLNSGSPLVLIDGVEGNLYQVNPNDVSSISVLKDASACAIYGAKASAGVILVTTKSGVAGETSISYNGRFSLSGNTTSTDFITTGYDYLTLVNEFYQNFKGKNAFTYTDAQMQMIYDRRNDKTENPERPWVIPDETGTYTWLYLGNFDWYDYMFKTIRPETEHNVSVSGGSDKVKYHVSGRYLYREGVFNAGAADDYNSFSFRSKIDIKLKKWLTYSNNTNFEHSSYNYGGFGSQDGHSDVFANHSAFWNANQNISPTYVPINPDGTINQQPGFMADNVSQLGSGRAQLWTDGRNRNARDRELLNMTNKLTFNIANGVTFTVDHTYLRRNNVSKYRSLPIANAYDNVNKKMYAAPGYTSGAVYDYLQESRGMHAYHIANAFFNYGGSFGRHNIASTVGVNYESAAENTLTVRQDGSLSESLSFISLAGGTISALNENIQEYATLGFFGRVNYDFAGRYLFEVSARYDGTSRFPAHSRWGFFPSFSAGWNISQEPFWNNLKNWWPLNKIRLSYGALGNQQVSNYYYFDTISTKTLSYTFDGLNKAQYAAESDPKSSNLTWETIVTYNVGVDWAFLDNRLSITADAFMRDTKDMLTTSMTLPSVYGAAAPKENCADLRTTGYELSIVWKDHFKLSGKTANYSVRATLGDNKTIITRYNNPSKLLSTYYEGMELGTIWGYHVDGLFESDESAEIYQYNFDDRSVNSKVYDCYAPNNRLMAGDLRFADLNGDFKIDKGANTLDDHGDLYRIGNSLPRYQYSFKGDFSWSGIDFSVFFQGIGKCDWMPNYQCDYFWGPYRNQRPTFIARDFEDLCWSEENPDAYFPRRRSQYANGSSMAQPNDRYLQNCAYLRLKNLTIGYTLPLGEKAVVKNCRIYFSGENLFYWSPMKKYCNTIDPEIATSDSANDSMYPYSRVFSIGVDIKF